VSASSEAITASLHNWSLFAQDTWQSTDRLTVTHGLRWEINTPPVSITPGKPLYAIEGIFDSKPLQLASPGTPLWRTRYNNFAPRLGAAYQLNASTIVRGGAGVRTALEVSGLSRTVGGERGFVQSGLLHSRREHSPPRGL
jgi:outer membrane receptor protein involved in Fe transport